MKADPACQALYARVVLDTNVLLSAALSSRGAPARLLDVLLQFSRLVVSPATFAELEVRVWLPKFDRYLSIERRRQLLRDVNAAAHWVDVGSDLASVRYSRDPSDDAFIHAALAAKAMRVVSGDVDLLCLHPLDGVHILSPRDALSELTGQ